VQLNDTLTCRHRIEPGAHKGMTALRVILASFRRALIAPAATIMFLLSNSTPHAVVPLASPYTGPKTAAIPAQATPPVMGDANDGRRLALMVCSACHVISPTQEFKPILQPAAPSFGRIANQPHTTAASLRHFITTTHKGIVPPHQMSNPELSDEQIANVVSFIMSLRHRR
jgi:mono/diheme cytochrome c family protein